MESKFHCSYSGLSSVMSYTLDIDRIIEMAWEDRTPFEAIEYQFGIKENEVRKIMRENLKRSSFERWRKRVKGRKNNYVQEAKDNLKLGKKDLELSE